jgi:hypothetical protein
MGLHGFNAGGFAYMELVTCPRCGRRYKLGARRRRRGDLECLDRVACDRRRKRRQNAASDQPEEPKR